MDLDIERDNAVTGETAHGLTFDSGSALLIATYDNEMAAYRAKKEWQKILNAYFLLDPERDYEMWVTTVDDESMSYMLTSIFHSACGRYAFWRIVNDQSPEAENKLALGSDTYSKQTNRWFSAKKKPQVKDSFEEDAWGFNSEQSEIDTNSRSFVDYLMTLLK